MRSVLLMEREKDRELDARARARDAPINIYTRSAVSSEQFVVSRIFSGRHKDRYPFLYLYAHVRFYCT